MNVSDCIKQIDLKYLRLFLMLEMCSAAKPGNGVYIDRFLDSWASSIGDSEQLNCNRNEISIAVFKDDSKMTLKLKF